MAASTGGAISSVPNVKIMGNLRSQTFMGSEAGAISVEKGGGGCITKQIS